MEQSAKIPFKKLNFMDAYKDIKPLFESGFIGLGEKVFEFERELAKYVGAKYCIAVDSCTSALFLSLKYEKPIEVSIPSMTVPLVANACLEAGAQIRFNSYTEWVGSSYQIMGSNVYDSAHQIDKGQYEKLFEENLYAKLCFSFYPTKPIGSADGGAIATNDIEFADWARSISTYGRNQKAKYANSWDYDVVMVGYKRHYTNLQAGICLEQLRRLDVVKSKLGFIRKALNDALGYNNVSDYLYRIKVDKRDEFIKFAAERGIECGVHFKPLHLMTPFLNVPMTIPDKLKVENDYAHTVSLPFFTEMTSEEVARIIDCVKDYEAL
jgi:dTDP-4-amino-4,6-dideoxygalactose transaminase